MIVKENTCISFRTYATTLTTDGPTRLVDPRNPVFPTPFDDHWVTFIRGTKWLFHRSKCFFEGSSDR